MAEEKTTFEVLNSLNVSGKIEKKNNLNYLSWAWAWGELKKKYPDANYTVYENKDGWNYHTDGKTCWVKCGVTVNGLEHIETLAVMDYKNQSIPFANVKSTDVIKSIQRCVTKAIGRHGLGLYIYAGEDIPEESTEYAPENKKSTLSPEAERERTKSMSDDFSKLKDEVVAFMSQGFMDQKQKDYINNTFASGDINKLKDILAWCKSESKKAS